MKLGFYVPWSDWYEPALYIWRFLNTILRFLNGQLILAFQVHIRLMPPAGLYSHSQEVTLRPLHALSFPRCIDLRDVPQLLWASLVQLRHLRRCCGGSTTEDRPLLLDQSPRLSWAPALRKQRTGSMYVFFINDIQIWGHDRSINDKSAKSCANPHTYRYNVSQIG